MKDKTHAMNRGFDGAPESGFEKISDSEVPRRRKYKTEQLKDAHLLGNQALTDYENPHGSDEGTDNGGFLPRNNYSDRY